MNNFYSAKFVQTNKESNFNSLYSLHASFFLRKSKLQKVLINSTTYTVQTINAKLSVISICAYGYMADVTVGYFTVFIRVTACGKKLSLWQLVLVNSGLQHLPEGSRLNGLYPACVASAEVFSAQNPPSSSQSWLGSALGCSDCSSWSASRLYADSSLFRTNQYVICKLWEFLK